MGWIRQKIQFLKTKNTFLQIVAWIWKDALRPNYKKIRWITFLQTLSVIASFSGFALLYFYVNKIETNQSIRFLHYVFEPRHSETLLLLFSGVVGLLLLSTALLDYGFHRQLLRLNYIFETQCVIRLYQSIIEKAHLLNDQDKAVLAPYNIKKSFIKDTKFYSRALFVMIKAVIPVSKLILSLAFMFYLAFSFTLLVVLLMALGGLFIWRVSKSVVQETKRKEKYIKVYVRELVQALIHPVPSQHLLSNEGAKNYYDAFYSWKLNTQKKRFIINVLIAVITLLLLMIIGHLTLFGSTSWALLIGYLLGLRYLLNSLHGINGILFQFSTFYDYIRNYYGIISALAELSGPQPHNEMEAQKIVNDYFQFQPDDDEGDDLADDF